MIQHLSDGAVAPPHETAVEIASVISLDFSRRGTPTDNAVVESFNGRLRQECLNEHWFLSLADARSKIGEWRTFYNEDRPHSALAWKTPAEFARECGAQVSS